MANTVKLISVACVMGVLALGSTGSFAYSITCPGAGPSNGCSLPNTVDGSNPYIDAVVTVDYNGKNLEKKGYFDVKAKSVKNSIGTLVDDSGTEYSIEKLKYDLKAKAYEGGNVEKGTVKIKGSIEGKKIEVKADLTPEKKIVGKWDSGDEGMLWAFNTYNIECKGLEAYVNCTTAEVAFLNLLSPIGPDTGFDRVSTAGRALTSVPLPAAAWLFVAGLMGLATVSRRRGQRA